MGELNVRRGRGSGFAGLLLDGGLASVPDLIVAERHAAREGLDPADALIALGLVDEIKAYHLLARAAGLPFTRVTAGRAGGLARHLVPERLARRYLALPLAVDNRTLTYATCRPFDREAEADLAVACGRRLVARVATRSAILAALDQAYSRDGRREGPAVGRAHQPEAGPEPGRLDSLGYDQPTLVRLEAALARPDGLVIVTGPTGAGKTTTLYGALGYLRTRRGDIVTVEDPIEAVVPCATQIRVNPEAGNSFASVLRALLRHDPNVIMVSEVRDQEVAQIVEQAARTGHLVLTSLRTAEAAAAVARLMDLGLEPFSIADHLAAVVAQRLVRTLCPSCRHVHTDVEARRIGAEHGLASIPASAGSGCRRCGQTGFEGRTLVAELLTPSEPIRAAIARGATSPEIRAAMRASGFPSLRDQALDLVRAGITSIEEVDRVLAADAPSLPGSRLRTAHRVLVVEDEPITRRLVKHQLERDGYEVLEAADGAAAVAVATRELPELILTDLHMPTMDGYQAIERMRADERLAAVPILVLTAQEGAGVERRVLELGADDYMLKPFEPDLLLSRVKAAFRRLRLAA